MREPPLNLNEATLPASLRAHYGLRVDALTFLPLGHDAAAAVYRAEAAGATYFLKIRTRLHNEASLLVPRFLHDQGIEAVSAPLPTTSGALWAPADDFVLILYPFITGTPGLARGLSDQQWRALGALLRQIHAATPTAALARLLQRDTYGPTGADLVRRLDGHLTAADPADPVEQALAHFWREQRALIFQVLERAEALGQRLAASAPPMVLCHADIHTNNVLIDEAERLWIIDWDETMLAPRERDLMFVIGGISRHLVTPRQAELCLQGYGPATVDPLGLAYYRYAWAISDLSAYGEQVCFRDDLSLAVRRSSLADFQTLFQPGRIISIALESD